MNKFIALSYTTHKASAYSKCWWGYEISDWEENYGDGSITSINETRWKLNDLGYNWGGNGAFYAYDGYRELNQPMPDGNGNGMKFSCYQDYCTANPSICTDGNGNFATYAGSQMWTKACYNYGLFEWDVATVNKGVYLCTTLNHHNNYEPWQEYDQEWLYSATRDKQSYVPKMWYENRLDENGNILLAPNVANMDYD